MTQMIPATPRRRYHVGNLHADLLRHARTILEEAGIAALNLRSLAARAGIAPGSVYHHYANKNALLAGLAAEGFGELRAQLERAAREAPAGARIRGNVRAYVAFAQCQPALYALMFDPAKGAHPDVCAASEDAFTVMADLIAEVMGEARPVSAEVVRRMALAAWTCAHGAASMSLSRPDQGGDLLDEVLAGLEALFVRA